MSTYIRRLKFDPTLRDRGNGKSNWLFRQMFNGMARGWRRRKMIAALNSMDDRLLRDIGLYRVDIERLVNGFDVHELRMVPMAPTTPVPQPDYEAYQKAA